MSVPDLLTSLFMIIGGFFFLAGTVGILRFPDVYTRLHAITKADNIGLGFIVIGVAIQVSEWQNIIKLALIWGLVMVAAATVAHLIARSALLQGQEPWEKAE